MRDVKFWLPRLLLIVVMGILMTGGECDITIGGEGEGEGEGEAEGAPPGGEGEGEGEGEGPGVTGGLLTGQVSSTDGSAIASVSVFLDNGRSASTDSNGFYSFSGLTEGVTIIARFSKDGFASTTKAFTIEEDDSTPGCVIMAPAAQTVTLNVDTEDQTARSGDSAVTIETGSLVDQDGNPVTGMIELTATFIDPSTDEVMAFPGAFEDAMDDGNNEVTLESFGFAIYELTQDGEPIDLAPGQTATIEYVLPDNAQSDFSIDDTIPLWEFDEDTAMWIESGVGTVGLASDSSGRLAWFAEVPHFSAWNCDAPLSAKHCITGRVLADGVPVNGAQISAVGISYNGTSTARTDANGEFCVDVKRGSTVRIELRLNGSAAAVATQEVTVPDTSASCATGGCTTIDDMSVSFDSCVMGHVTDNDGNPLAGVTVHVVPGETVTTDATGAYCAKAPGNLEIFVFAPGRPSVRVMTSPTGSCATGNCVEADLTLAFPEDGDVVGFLSAGKSLSINVFGEEVVESLFFDLSGLFIFLSEGLTLEDLFQGGFGIGDFSSETEQVGDCTVTTTSITIDSSDIDALGDAPVFQAIALDPGAPGIARNNGTSVDLLRGDPNSVDPPLPLFAGIFSPVESDLLGLGFDAGQTITFEFPGGADIGPFSASIEVPNDLVILSPDLTDPNLVLDSNSPLNLTWAAGNSSDRVHATVHSSSSDFMSNPDGSFTSTTTDVTIRCDFPDTGSGTISADAMGRLLDPSDFTSLNITRTRTNQVEVPFLQVDGTGIVQLEGRTDVLRSFFDEMAFKDHPELLERLKNRAQLGIQLRLPNE